jgi:integrase
MGRVFRQPYTKKRADGTTVRRLSHTWFIEFWDNGQRRTEKTSSTRKPVATALLKQRLGEVAAGKYIPSVAKATTLDTLLGLVETDYTINGRRSLKRVKELAVHLKEYFGAQSKVAEITEVKIDFYVQHRLGEKAARATVNRELATLRRAFRLGQRKKLVASIPHLTLLDERDNVRQGFFEPSQMLVLLEALPRELRDVTEFGCLSGCRLGEILSLQWADVDREGRAIRLRPANTKTKAARVIPLEGQLAALIEERWVVRHGTDAAGQDRIIPYVFHRRGKPIKDFRGAWTKACEAAKVPGRLFHDLRRSAVRNMVRAGVDPLIAMRISGHKTRSVFDRYNIVSETDLRDALRRTDTYRNAATAATQAGRSEPAPVLAAESNRLSSA